MDSVNTNSLADDVLAEFGYTNLPPRTTVIQNNDNIMLEPPAIEEEPVGQLSLPNNSTREVENFMQEVDELLESASNIDDTDIDDTPFEEDVPTPTVEELIDNNIIPANKQVDLDDNVSRFKGADWYDAVKTLDITVIGLGGIGSMATFMLARLNVANLRVFDGDVVESGNMSGQLYGVNHIGRNKARCISDINQDFSNYYHTQYNVGMFNNDSIIIDNIVVCGLDNMRARKLCFSKWRDHLEVADKSKCLFVDGRLSLEELQVFCIMGNDEDAIVTYSKEYLFDDSEAEQVVCSRKQSTYCAAMIGALITNVIVNFTVSDFANVPFKTYYNAKAMNLITEI